MNLKKVLVTGGSRGIGLGIALRFAREGFCVGIVGRSQQHLIAAQEKAAQQGLVLHVYSCDLQDSAQLTDTVSRFAKQHNGLDILCCNAGIFPSAPLAEMTEQQWDDVQAVNSKGTFLSVKAALPWLKQAEYGRVVITSSITGPVTGYPGWAHYAASKAAQLGFMRTAALELAGWNITVNAVLPGNIFTEGLESMGEAYAAAMINAVPLKRLGTVEDIAAAVHFLASKEAGFITGQTLIVDGGQILPESTG
ncbi:3-oxoacyl-ACP reductase FabG [Vagococcus sp. WN89Y]|uniref:3-oxoacyl-ACP reductase FabG n=1 Tax=Vagococcus sp. WN89Y TaxID=3457258 RepID=UPI003FCED34B